MSIRDWSSTKLLVLSLGWVLTSSLVWFSVQTTLFESQGASGGLRGISIGLEGLWHLVLLAFGPPVILYLAWRRLRP